MSMWEPRSSHLYVCTGLRVCERSCVCVGTPCLRPHRGHSGAGCACQCVPWCVRVSRGHYPLHLSTCAQFSVCLRYVTPCVVHASVRPASGHALVWALRVGVWASPEGRRVGLREGACGHICVKAGTALPPAGAHSWVRHVAWACRHVRARLSPWAGAFGSGFEKQGPALLAHTVPWSASAVVEESHGTLVFGGRCQQGSASHRRQASSRRTRPLYFSACAPPHHLRGRGSWGSGGEQRSLTWN